MNSKSPLAKYLLGGVAAGALAISAFPVQAQGMTTTTTTTMNSTVSAEPSMVSGTVDGYWMDRSGYVTAMSVRTNSGTEIIRFSPSQARRLYTTHPVGSNVDVWVTPGAGERRYWDARGLGADRPTVWYPINSTTDYDWLSASPYTLPGANEVTASGKLRGVVIDNRGDVLALAIENASGWTMVRVPAELRHVARGHIGSNRVAPLIKGSDIDVKGVPEAPRWGVLSPVSSRIAANTISVNGKHAGAVGIQMLPPEQRDSLLNWDVGSLNEDGVLDADAQRLGYSSYRPVGEPMGDYIAPTTVRPMTSSTTTTTVTERATGRVMIVTPSGQMLPVVRRNNRIWVTTTGGQDVELQQVNGKYTVPASMTGSRMLMVMADGRRMEMDTVNGQLMVVMADGSMAPVTLHTP